MRSHGGFSQIMNPSVSSEEAAKLGREDSGRRIYPYSIIRGGIETVEELQHAIQLDPVAAKHFTDFDLSQARIVRLPVEKVAYVSYRVKDKVYWTRKKIKLARGEKLITDGVNSARTRCANRISETPGPGLGPQEPPPGVFDTPEKPPVAVPTAKLLPPTNTNQRDFTPPVVTGVPGSPAVPSGTRLPLFIPPVVVGGIAAGSILRPSSPRSGLPPISASEPGAFLLLASGFAASVILLKGKRK